MGSTFSFFTNWCIEKQQEDDYNHLLNILNESNNTTTGTLHSNSIHSNNHSNHNSHYDDNYNFGNVTSSLKLVPSDGTLLHYEDYERQRSNQWSVFITHHKNNHNTRYTSNIQNNNETTKNDPYFINHHRHHNSHHYHNNNKPIKDSFLFSLANMYVLSCTIICILQPLLVNCDQEEEEEEEQEDKTKNLFDNPNYSFISECYHYRQIKLLYLTPQECIFGRRILFATILGSFIGWERRHYNGKSIISTRVRTNALVSLGSCLFAICGMFAFLDGPMGWDASRISAAIPSGVGFVGAGLIWKYDHYNQSSTITTATSTRTNEKEQNNVVVVHGLTTAASVWLSAAVGIACSGGLFFAASFTVALMLILLRFGPTRNPKLDTEV